MNNLVLIEGFGRASGRRMFGAWNGSRKLRMHTTAKHKRGRASIVTIQNDFPILDFLREGGDR